MSGLARIYNFPGVGQPLPHGVEVRSKPVQGVHHDVLLEAGDRPASFAEYLVSIGLCAG